MWSMATAVSSITPMEGIQSSGYMDVDSGMASGHAQAVPAPQTEPGVPEKKLTPADFRRVRTLGTGKFSEGLDRPQTRPIDTVTICLGEQEPLREYASFGQRTRRTRTETKYMP